MDYDRFIAIVERALDVGRERAERATEATLQTLAERIDRGEARQLAAELPPELAPWLHKPGPAAEGFDVDEFMRRVAEREGVDVPTAERHVRAVFTALGQAVEPKELADLLAELPRAYRPYLPRGPFLEVIAADAFLRRVAERSGVDPEDARDVASAVLEALAERIAGGEVEDLIARLPVELHPPLRWGSERTGAKATRAVFTTLREAVGDEEFFDVTAELPGEYATALAGR